MPSVHALEEFRFSPTACLFEGKRDDLNASFFYVRTAPGQGPGLHVHPYPEVFLVQEGEATFTIGDEQAVVTAESIVVVPAETPHGFKNTGTSPLRVVSVHPSPEVRQTWLEEE